MSRRECGGQGIIQLVRVTVESRLPQAFAQAVDQAFVKLIGNAFRLMSERAAPLPSRASWHEE